MAKPKFLYDNRFSDATPVASSTAAGDFNVLNLRDWRPFTWWKPTAVPATVTVDSVSAQARDYALVYGEAGTYEARGSTDNFSASNVLLATITLTATGLGLAVFASQSFRYTRLTIPSGSPPAVAIAAIGAALEAPVFFDGEFSPIDRKVHGHTNRNESCHAIGRIVEFESWESQLRFKNVSWTWARDTFLPAWKSKLRGQPFGFCWDSGTFPGDIRLVAAGEKLAIPHRAGSLCDVEIDVEGVAP
jgi:hypothetical protein